MKGIILAGGAGSRLYPLTSVTSKQLLPIYDKPMIYYSLSILMLAKIRDILIITTKEDQKNFKKLLGTGKDLGIKIIYKIQKKPKGIAEAFIIAENFIKSSNVCLILGDNIFYGQNFVKLLEKAKQNKTGATLFAYHVKDPERFGVINYDNKKNIISIEEKPKKPKSNFAITGLYFYDNTVISKAKNLKPSKRNELEITEINNMYLKEKKLNVEILGRGSAWLDTGTFDTLLEASQFVQIVEKRQGLIIACLEEIALNNKWLSKKELLRKIKLYKNTKYHEYLRNFILN